MCFSVIVVLLLFHTSSMLAGIHFPKADLVVARDGSGDFTTLQAAINAAPDSSRQRFVILVKNGMYITEKLIVPATKMNLTLIGEDRKKTIISYHMYDCKSPESGNKCPADAWALWKNNKDLIRTSATLTIMADGFHAENLTIANTAGPVGQGLALTLRADRASFVNCDILGYQDTIYMWNDGKRTYFAGCLVLGRTDYIYGGGIGFFENCEIRSFGGGWVTAPSTPDSQSYGFVFHRCNFTYALHSPRSGDDGDSVALGRPWHKYPKVAILNSDLCEHIHPRGWPTIWNMDYAATSDKLHLYEYRNTGKGADMSQRAHWAGLRTLTDQEAAEYTLEKVLHGWNPEKE